MKLSTLGLLFVFFLVALVNSQAQSVFSIAPTPVCWVVSGVDSSLVRYMLISSRTPATVSSLVYRNAAGSNVTITPGGTLYLGACACCTRDTLPIPRVENYSEVVPLPNPMDPPSLTYCYRGQAGYLYGITDPTTQIVATSDGVPLTYVGSATATLGQWSYDPTNKFFRALSPNYGTGSGTHDIQFTVTIPAGTLNRVFNFDCGS